MPDHENELSLHSPTERWAWLADTWWYVPPAYLPALLYEPGTDVAHPVSDQTVWHIREYHYGYLVGDTWAAFKSPDPGVEVPVPGPLSMVGSVMPDGSVQITFLPKAMPAGGLLATQGWGKMQESEGRWVFAMQMSTGTTSLVSHWAKMYPTWEGEPSWNHLPGTGQSLPDFITTHSDTTTD